MIATLLRRVAVLAALLLWATAATAQSVVRGAVTAIGGKPLAGAEVRLLEAGVATRSDSVGAFVLRDFPAGRYRLAVRALGYDAVEATLDVPVGGLDGVEVELQPTVTTLSRVEVRDTAVAPYLRSFVDNRRMGIGHFADSTVLWAGGDPSNWAQRLQERVPGLRLVSLGSARVFASQRGVTSLRRLPACYVRVIIDGVVRYNSTLGEAPFDVTNWNEAPIVAAEYYTTAQMPVRYNQLGTAACGALVLWTRR